MNHRELERLLWMLTTCVVAVATAAWFRWRQPISNPSHQWVAEELVEIVPSDSGDRSERIVMRDPFRLSRRPSSTPFQSQPLNGAITASQMVRPILVLNGVVGGPPWSAVVTGLPGRDGNVVVHEAEIFGPLRIQVITRDGVVIQGLDTTWHLLAKRVPR